MAQLSVVIPLVGDVAALETTLVSVLSQRPDDCEVLVLLATPYDDPYQLDGEVTFLDMADAGTLAEGLNTALASATAPIIHVLAAGVEVTAGWADEPLEMFSDPRVAAVSSLVLDRDDDQRVVSAGVAYSPSGRRKEAQAGCSLLQARRQRGAHLGPSRLAGFYRRVLVEDLGGFQPCVGDAHFDADLALRLVHAGYHGLLAESSQVTMRPTRRARRSWRTGAAAERMFWRNAPVIGWGRSLSWHLGLLTVELARAVVSPGAAVELLGRLSVWPTVPLLGRHYRQLRQLIGLAEAELAAFGSGSHEVSGLSGDGEGTLPMRTAHDMDQRSASPDRRRRARSA